MSAPARASVCENQPCRHISPPPSSCKPIALSLKTSQSIITRRLAGLWMGGQAIPVQPISLRLGNGSRTMIATPGQRHQNDPVLWLGNARLVFDKPAFAAVIPRPDGISWHPSIDESLHDGLQPQPREASVLSLLATIDAAGCQQRAGIHVPGGHQRVDALQREVVQFGFSLVEGDEPGVRSAYVCRINRKRIRSFRARYHGLKGGRHQNHGTQPKTASVSAVNTPH